VSEDRRRRGLVPTRDELGPALGFWLVLIVVLVILFVLGSKHLL